MRRKRLFLLCIIIGVVVTFLVLHTFGYTGIGIRMNFQTISKAFYSGIETAECRVIQDNTEWANLWNLSQQIYPIKDPLPRVDFSKKMIIAVSMGTRRSSGYEIEVKEIIDTGLTVVVKVQNTYPAEGYGVLDIITNPYHIVEIEKISKPIIFNTR